MNSIKEYLRKFLPEDFILWTHKARAILAAFIYGFPARHLKVIGVTGTNGKTTTCNLIARILEEAGHKVGLATTINFKIDRKEWVNETKMTTIDPFMLQKLLKDMVKANCNCAVIETTSHALMQYRNWGIRYHTVVLTNITHEHLDYHGNYAKYRAAKLKLFSYNPQVSVVNRDDRAYHYFAKMSSQKHLSYALENKADIVARKILFEPQGTLFTAVTPHGQIAINLSLPGRFNIYNSLAAISVAIAHDIKLETIKSALEKVKNLPGRMETVGQGQDFTVIIDYAHTPDAFENIYQTLKLIAKARIIHVFGACGDRDKTKRPIMGAQAGRYADYVIITNEDPYTEDPVSIIEQVASGVPRGENKNKTKKIGHNFFKILDRKVAIKKAISLAEKGDIVLITGKGAETVMVMGDKHIPWSDKKIVEEMLGK